MNLTVLFISANPSDSRYRLRLERERKTIESEKMRSQYKDKINFINWDGIQKEEIHLILNTYQPDILHFSGHLTQDGSLVFVNEDGKGEIVLGSQFIEAIRLHNKYLKCIILNGCYSDKISEQMHKYFESVIGMVNPIEDKDAIEFSQMFYNSLFSGKSMEESLSITTNHLKLLNRSLTVKGKIRDSTENNSPIFTVKDSEGLSEMIRKYSEGTYNSISKNIDNISFQRPIVDEILNSINKNENVVIIGEKGIGKSVILTQVYEKLSKEQYLVLFLRGDFFTSLKNENDIFNIIGISKSDLDLLESSTLQNRFSVIIDSLDSIARDDKLLNAFKNFFVTLFGSNITTLVSMREFDYNYTPSIKKINLGRKISIGRLDIKNVKEMLKKLGIFDIKPNLMEILRNPLSLKLFYDLNLKKKDSQNIIIDNEFSLYDHYWREFVDDVSTNYGLSQALFDICKIMVDSRKVYIPTNKLKSIESLQPLLSNSILIMESTNIRFFHQAFFDYIFSLYLMNSYTYYTKFLKENDLNIFIRPSFKLALDYLRMKDKSRYLKTILEILNSNLTFYWKVSALMSLVESNEFRSNDLKSIESTIRINPFLKTHFILACYRTKNSHWMDIWNETLLDQISKENDNINFLFAYIKEIIVEKQIRSKLFPIIKNVVGSTVHKMIARELIVITKEIFFEGKSEWYLSLSKSSSPEIREGVLKCLKEHIKDDPCNTSQIFSNIFTFREKLTGQIKIFEHGTLLMNMDRRQYDNLVLCNAVDLFEELIKIAPHNMINSVESIILKLYGHHFIQVGNMVDDRFKTWYKYDLDSNLNSLIEKLISYLQKSSGVTTSKLISLLKKNRLSIFHYVLLDFLLSNPVKNKSRIYTEIAKQNSLNTISLHPILIASIKSILGTITYSQRERLLDKIMKIQLSHYRRKSNNSFTLGFFDFHGFEDVEYITEEKRIKSKLLLLFPIYLLNSNHIDTINEGFQYSYEDGQGYINLLNPKTNLPKPAQIEERKSETFESEVTNISKNKKNILEDAFHLMNGQSVDEKILPNIKSLLLKLMKDQDPDKNESPSAGIMLIGNFPHDPGVRGYVALNLILLYKLTLDKSLLIHIKALSLDRINVVNWIIAINLKYLIDRRTEINVIKDILKRYSMYDDITVKFNLSSAIQKYINVYGNDNDIYNVIENIIRDTTKETLDFVFDLVDLIVKLDIEDEIPLYKELMEKIILSDWSPDGLKRAIAHRLKENYLLKEEYQVRVINYYELLLNDKSHEVRYFTSFFLTYTIGQKEERFKNLNLFLNEIKPLVEKISDEGKRTPSDPRIIEHFLEFLNRYMVYFYDDALRFANKISKIGYSPFNPKIVEESIKILIHFVEDNSIDEKSKQICIEVLNRYISYGCSGAIDLLDCLDKND